MWCVFVLALRFVGAACGFGCVCVGVVVACVSGFGSGFEFGRGVGFGLWCGGVSICDFGPVIGFGLVLVWLRRCVCGLRVAVCGFGVVRLCVCVCLCWSWCCDCEVFCGVWCHGARARDCGVLVVCGVA